MDETGFFGASSKWEDGPYRVKTVDKVLMYTTGTACSLCVLFAVAAIFVPDFREGGGNIVFIILSALTTMLGAIMTGSYFARDIKQAPEKEVGRSRDEEGNG